MRGSRSSLSAFLLPVKRPENVDFIGFYAFFQFSKIQSSFIFLSFLIFWLLFRFDIFGKNANVLSLRGGLATFFCLVADGIFDVQKLPTKTLF